MYGTRRLQPWCLTMSKEIETLKTRYVNSDIDKYQFEQELDRLMQEDEVTEQEKAEALTWIYLRKAKKAAIAFSVFVVVCIIAWLAIAFKSAAIIPIGVALLGAVSAWVVADLTS